MLKEFLARLSSRELEIYRTDFYGFAHEHQLPPTCANSGEAWTTWLMLGGRGAGKTRAGAEWVRSVAARRPERRRIALIGETEHDAREVMVEGVSGLLARASARRAAELDSVAPPAANGRTARWRRCFRPKIRKACAGRNSRAAWCDELAKWRHAEATFDMLQFGLRLGERPRQVDHDHAAADRADQAADRRSRDRGDARRRRAPTRCNLAPAFLDAVVARYAGTRLGRQELDGEIIEERADALWSRALHRELAASTQRRRLQRIVVAVDPPASARQGRRRLRPGRRRPRRGRHDLCARRRDRGRAVAGRLGARRRSRCGGGFRPMRWWPRSTRAATWCAR